MGTLNGRNIKTEDRKNAAKFLKWRDKRDSADVVFVRTGGKKVAPRRDRDIADKAAMPVDAYARRPNFG